MRSVLFIGVAAAGLLLAGNSHAAPPAGASIGNQASATYTDDSAVARSVTSNTVVTIVQQVASLTLSANGAKTGNPGGQVAFPHTVTNTGNGTDTLALASSQPGGSSFNFSSVTLYADANGDGVPDNSTPITSTGELASGAVFKFVAVGVVPNTANAGNANTLIVTATSGHTPAVNASNTDTTTITTQGVVNVTQSLDVIFGPSPSTGRLVTLTYTNTGNTTATNLVLTDVLPSGMTYVANSARWSVTGSGTVLTDAADGTQGTSPTIAYDFGQTVSGRVTATISSIPAGASGTVTFRVDVNSGLPTGANAATRLTARYAYNDGSAPVAQADTNTVQYTVAQTATIDVADATTVASAAQGATVTFTNAVRNLGNGADTINLTFGTSSFPAGTTFQVFRADGAAPLVDSNSDGVPDTGPVAAGATVNVVVKATLPVSVGGGGSYAVQLVGTSAFDPTRSDFGTDTLTTIGANTVDLVNDTTPQTGVGAGPEVAAETTNTVAPGNTTRFPLVVNNGSSVADSFNLTASTDSTFASLTIPSGWTVVFHDANGAVITSTGVIAAGGSRTVYADVTAPANATSGFDLYLRALSPSSGVGDRLHNAVEVGTVRSLVLTPNNTGQVVSGGTVVYTHRISNTGTATEGDGTSTVALATSSTAGFTSVIHWDQNNNGMLDASDPIVSSLAQLTGGSNGASTAAGLSPGEVATLFVKVTAAPGAANGVTDTTTLTATVTGAIGGVAAPAAVSASDTTSVIVSNVTLVKLQALDADCDGTIEGSYTSNALGAGAIPGACVRYQITATNAGGANILSLVVSDATPANTTYHGTVAAATTVGSVAAPAAGAAGTVQATVGTLAPGTTAVLTFGVRIDP